MATPTYDFNIDPLDGPLSQAEIDKNDELLHPDQIFNDHNDRQTAALDRVNSVTQARLKEENALLAERVQRAEQQNAQLSDEQSYLRGRLDSMDAKPKGVDPALEYSEEELAAHGHALPTVSKAAKREALLMEEKIRRELSEKYDKEIALLRQQTADAIAAQEQTVQSVTTSNRSNFDATIKREAAKIGLSISQMKKDDRFFAKCAQPLAVGSSILWGEQLDHNIESMNPTGTLDMLQQYAKEIGVYQADGDAMEVPASSNVRPLTPDQQNKLDERIALINKADSIQDQFLDGMYPGTNEEYQKEKRELLAKADAISISV